MRANLIQSRTFRAFEIYLASTLMYLALAVGVRKSLQAFGKHYIRRGARMIGFTLWDMVRHLLVGADWTILLSAIAFMLGRAMGLLILFVRISPKVQFQALGKAATSSFQDTRCSCSFSSSFRAGPVWR